MDSNAKNNKEGCSRFAIKRIIDLCGNIQEPLIWVGLVVAAIMVIVGVGYFLFKLSFGFASLDVAIQVALLSFFGSCVGFILSKRYDLRCRLQEQLELKRRTTYEHIVSFLFECQARSGHDIKIGANEIELRCSNTTQEVLLWASDRVQIEWQKYLYFRHSNKGGQNIIARLLFQIGRELGHKYWDTFFACYRPLEFFYNCNEVEYCPSEDSDII